jgi:predicted RNA-binding Zn-ribbon protein involved in translation (DUF1610 family)
MALKDKAPDRRCGKPHILRRIHRHFPCYSRAMTEVTKFRCPTCDAEYLVVRVEASSTHDNPLLCLSCGGPLQNRDGRFALKYFRKSGSKRMNGRKPRLR